MRRLAPLALVALALTPARAATPAARFTADPPPRLVVVLVVDQLRADYLGRFRAALGDDGIGELLTRGAWYPYAEYDIIQAMTGPGHATLATGTWPVHHGIVLNYWADRATGAKVYCAEDPAHPLLGAATIAHAGSGPRHLRAPTLGDALKNSGQPSRVVAVAMKDRAAILMGGHRADDVVWFDDLALRWLTSRFYRPDGARLPWVDPIEAALARRRGEAIEWQIGPGGSGLSDDGPATFHSRHVLGEDRDAVEGPLGPRLVVDAALAAAAAHRLGEDETPDLLWISFSTFDRVGHDAGPNDRRMEALLEALDAEIARLLDALAARVPGGRDALTVVLTGDHGVGPTPEYAARHRLPAGRLDFDAVERDAEKTLSQRFGPPPGGGKWVRGFRELNLYLTPHATAEHRAAIAASLATLPSVRYAVTREAIEDNRLPPPPLDRRIRHQFDPERSGDVMLVLRPYHIYAYGKASHLTGYAYDRYVPLVLMGRPFRPGLRPEPAQIIDVAPTLSFVLGIQPPAMSEGRVLAEALHLDAGASPAKRIE